MGKDIGKKKKKKIITQKCNFKKIKYISIIEFGKIMGANRAKKKLLYI